MTNDRRSLALQAMHRSIEVRTSMGRDLKGPICVYSLCDDLKVKVRFVDVSMEGMYRKGVQPLILLSALRPAPRRVFTCAHELGHYAFGHGSTVDALVQKADQAPPFDPCEFLADTFAGFLLMPTVGIRRAFVARGWRPETATPEQIYIIACSFGVGFETLIGHLCYSLQMINRQQAAGLAKSSPKAVRSQILGEATADPLIVADEHWELPTLDVEVGSHLLLPKGTEAASGSIALEAEHAAGRLFRAMRPGIVRVVSPGTPWAVFVRVSRYQFVGLSQYRHLEEVEGE
jgi:Zn-dependent peptidase ImmA (M78 family)